MAIAADVDARGKAQLSMAFAVLLIPAILGSSATIFNDGDVSWHIATGQWILDNRAIPRTDPFSFTWAGQPWVPIEWLAEVLMAATYRLAGYSGIAALVTAALMLLHAIVFFNALRHLDGRLAIAVVGAMDLVLIPMLLARPHLIGWSLVALWTWLMLRAREREDAPPLAAALLMIVWANLHGSFAIGLVIAAAFGLEALMAAEDKRRAFRDWILFGIACAIAVLINANGFAGMLHPLKIANLEMLPLISEWKPSNPRVTPFFFAILALTAALIWWRRPRMHPVRWLLLAFLLAMAMYQVRHQAVLAIVGAMLLPSALARDAERRSANTKSMTGLIAAIALALVFIRGLMPVELPENERNPWRLIAAVPAELRTQPVLNGYSMGGPLILSGIRPYVDGRGDMYGDELVMGYKRITEGDAAALDQAVRRWNVSWAILPRRYDKLLALLDRLPEWRRIHEDVAGVIYVRRVPTAS